MAPIKLLLPGTLSVLLVLSGCASKIQSADPSKVTAPQISSQPQDQTVSAGATATFAVTATGTDPLTYQWSRNGTAIQGAETASYTTPASSSADNSAQFTVTVSNSAGSVTSRVAILTVNSVVSSAPTITQQPANQSVLSGESATFIVSAAGAAPLAYQWSKNGANITGATSASYTTPATVSGDNGATFKVVVSNAAGTVTSSTATLTVTVAVTAPSITQQPANQSVVAGATATFSVVASGTAPLSYQWSKSGVNIPGATAASYTTPTTATTDSGSTFKVVVSNSAGSVTSNTASLTVGVVPVAPSISQQPVNQSVAAGATATFTVVASGTAPLAYQWTKNGANIAGATSASYTTGATSSTDNGSTFAVVVSNAAGTVTSNAATLTVTSAVAPTITTQPMNQTVTAGGTATFTVVAAGTAPMSYQWSKNGANIAGATAASYTTPATTTTDSGSTFKVVVSNAAGTVTSNSATLTVSAVAPTITTQPSNQAVASGSTASFTVVAAGTAPLSYQWSKNGTAIAGATSASYTTPATTTADSGSTFSVVVSNSAGNVTSNTVTLTVSVVAPVITTQPADQTVVAGSTASFSVVATGSTPLTYQWMNGTQVISGATSASYTTPVTALSDSGSVFSVKVSNAAGSVNSSGATLTVNAAGTGASIRQFFWWHPSGSSHGGELSTPDLATGNGGWPAPTLQGSTLYAYVMSANDAHALNGGSTIVDSAGNAWNSPQDQTLCLGENFMVEQHWVVNAAPIGPTGTTRTNWAIFEDYHGVLWVEVTGAPSVLAHGGNKQDPHTGTTTDSLTSVSLNLSSQPAIVLAVSQSGGDFAAGPKAGTGFTLVSQDLSWDLPFVPTATFESKLLGVGTSSISATFTPAGGASETYCQLAVAFLSN